MENGNIKSCSTLAAEMSYNKINGGEAWADTRVVRNNMLLRFICRSFPVGPSVPSPLNIHAGDYWNSPATAIVVQNVCACLCVRLSVWLCVCFGWKCCFYVAGHLILKTPASWQYATVCLYFWLCCYERRDIRRGSKAGIWSLRRRRHFTECLRGARLVCQSCLKWLWGYSYRDAAKV